METIQKEFHCEGCGECCRWPGIVRVDNTEIARLATFLKLSEQEFIDKFTRLAPDRLGLVLVDAADGACCFLSPENRCRVHAVKPRQCRNFPISWQIPPEYAGRCHGKWI